MAMIFDNDKAIECIRAWRSGDKESLDQLFCECQSLVESIVSGFDPVHREDLIQTSMMKIRRAIENFDVERNLHKYLTSVIRNACIDFVQNENSQPIVVDIEGSDDSYGEGMSNNSSYVRPEEDFQWDHVIHNGHAENILYELVIRNRLRFPSVDVNLLDKMSEYIFLSIRDGYKGKSRGAISNMMKKFHVSRNEAITIYHSSLMYMRKSYINHFDISEVEEPDELSILKDLKEVVGEEAFTTLSALFGGMYVKFP